MGIQLITAPTDEPLTIDEAKMHCRVDHTDEDALIFSLIVAARMRVEHSLGAALITQTWEYSLDEFPEEKFIELPKSPLVSITSVKYLDSAGTEQTMDAAQYRVLANHKPAKIALKTNYYWPTTIDEPDAVTIRFVCGFGALGDAVPAPIRQAMLLTVGHLYENRSEVTNETSRPLAKAADYLLEPYKIYGHRKA